MPSPVAFGQPDPRNAQAVIDALLQAAEGCLDGRFDGVVTGPVHKAVINDGGIAYTGTTELLARAGRLRGGDDAGQRHRARRTRHHAPAAARGAPMRSRAQA